MSMARDYKKEYRKYQSSDKRRAYRAALNRKARKMGHYGKTPKGKELVHDKRGARGKIKGLGDKKANRRDGARRATMARQKNRRRRSKK